MGRFCAFLTVLLALVALLPGRLRADQQSALKVLEAKGLKRSVSNFALPEETDFGRQMRAIEALKKKLADAEHEAVDAARKVDDKKKTIIAYLQKSRELRAQLNAARTIDLHNNIVNALGELRDRIELLEKSDAEDKAMTNARGAANKMTEDYVGRILELRRIHDKVEAKYETLDADPQVTQAIEEFNKDAEKKLTLGPTTGFLSAGRKLKALEDIVLSQAIPLRSGQGGLWYVLVEFNGKYSKELSVDTGSSVIALPAKMASDVGMAPGPDAPLVQLTLADGHVVTARLVVAEKVRVGKFTAEHVECAVLPAELPNASALLGMSFLQNFIFKIDGEKGHLVMSKVDVPERPPKPGRTPHGRKTNAE
jgi:clan AA aspartic protease (TIGR02281 family)